MATINQKDVSKDWAARGFSCELWIDPPGQRWEDFVHGTDELVIVVEGEMEFEINGEISHPRTGEEIFILSLIHISEPTRPSKSSRMPSSA